MFQTDLQQFVFYDKYSKWQDDLGRRETWPETVQRCVEFLKELSQNKFDESLYNDIYQYILEGKVTPSMRLLASAGVQARKNNISLYNCFRRDTEFLTTSGVKSFLDFKDGDSVVVLDHEGSPQQAKVRNYGLAKMRKLELHRGRHVSKPVYVTENHRWLLTDATETTSLKTGDYLLSHPAVFDAFDYERATPLERLYWCYGFVYGDGTKVKDQNGKHKYSMVRLCGSDAKYEPRFLEMGFSSSSSLSLVGDVMVYTGGYLKTLPDPEVDSIENLRAFVRGYLDADGAKNNSPTELSSFKSITTYDSTTAEFIKRVFPVVGVHIFSEEVLDGTETNYGAREFCRRFRISTNLTNKTNGKFKVVFLDEWIEEDAWCLEVENTHSFLLNVGVATGNCSFLGVDSLHSFAEALFISMSGCGVGFSVEKKYIDQLPDLPHTLIETDCVHVVEDSAEGWYYALLSHLRSLFNGHILEFDYSLVRPKGAILKTKGGRASGPEPLKELLDFITNLFVMQAYDDGVEDEKTVWYLRGRLTSLNVFDIMCHVGNCAVSGGSRRTAMLCLFDLDDQQMKNAKTGQFPPVRYLSNNSAVWPREGIEFADFAEWMAHLFKYDNGEYSVWNAQPLTLIKDRRDISQVVGVNPCQPAFATVLTPDGIKQFKDIDVGSVIWSEKGWTTVTAKEHTGIKPVYKYHTSFGTFVGTENHLVFQDGQRVEVSSAKRIDSLAGPLVPVEIDTQDVMDGLVIGDGGVHKASNNLVLLYIGDKDGDYHTSNIAPLIIKHRPGINPKTWEVTTTVSPSELPATFDRYVPTRFYFGDTPKKCGFLRGLFSANGSIAGDRVTLKQSSYILIRQVQEMLSSVGIRAYITTNKPSMVAFSNGTYETKESYTLNITTDKYKYMALIGFIQNYKQPHRPVKEHRQTGIVQQVELLGEFPVYDITVDAQEHNYWTGGLLVSNCGEINLRNNQFCNLSSVVARFDDTKESLARKTKIAALIGTIQAMATQFPLLRDSWQKNCEEERLLGVDINGIMDCPLLIGEGSHQVLRYLKEVAIDTNQWSAKVLGINPATAVTCVKPNGNSSELLGCSSGMKPREARYYKRRVRVSVTSPIYKVLFQSGIDLQPENGQTWEKMNTAVATFYEKAPPNAKLQSEFSAVDMCNFWLKLKVNYTEHNPSVTIRYKPEEKYELFQWLWEHRDLIGGMTFLPVDQTFYPQAPFEEITEQEYEEALKPKVLWSLLAEWEKEDMTTSAQEVACSADSCVLV